MTFDVPERAQQDLFAAETAREAAINKVEYGKEAFILVAIQVVREIAEANEHFTTDALWDELDRREILIPPEARVFGAVMRSVGLLGIATATSSTRKSHRPECHARPVRVWASRVWDGA